MKKVNDYALRNLEYLENTGPNNIDPKHLYKLLH